MALHWSDYLIFAFCLVGSLLIGLYHSCSGGKQKTTAEYLTGNRKLNFLATSISLVISFYSAILIVGVPAEGYFFGWSYWLYSVGKMFAVFSSMALFVPVFYPLKLVSVNKYLELRFNSKFVKILGTLSGITNMYLYTATVFFAPAIAINALTGFSVHGLIVIGAAIGTLYTVLGGIKGVIYVDVFQAVLMITGLIAVCFRSISLIGGFGNLWETSKEWGRLEISFDPDPRTRFTVWSLCIGGIFRSLYKYGIHQASVQRFCSMPTYRKAQLSLLFVIPWSFVAHFLAIFSGLAIFAFYTSIGCDPLKGGFISNANQILPRFVGDVLNFPGMQGILLAALTAGSLSTASSTLNSAAANLYEDIVCQVWPNMTERKNVIITKLFVCLGGVLCTALAFMVKEIGGTVVQLTVVFTSSCGAPTTAMFLLGILVPFTNWIGAAAGGIGGFIFAVWVGIGSFGLKKKRFLPTTTANCTAYGREYLGIEPHLLNITTIESMLNQTTPAPTDEPEVSGVTNIYMMSYLWFGCFSMIIALIIGLVVSLLSGGLKQERVPGNLLHPVVKRFYEVGPDLEILDKQTAVNPNEMKVKEDFNVNGDFKVKAENDYKTENGYLDERIGGHDNQVNVTKM